MSDEITRPMRTNLATWAVPTCHIAAVANFLHDVLPNESYDPHFRGQEIKTTYFDTAKFHLRKARVKGDQYLTCRLRSYDGPNENYALSVKTEAEKWRQEISSSEAHRIFLDPERVRLKMPGHLWARMYTLIGNDPICAVAKVCCRRYACENVEDRYTLDTAVSTDRGKCLSTAVLEFKSTVEDAIPGLPADLVLPPMKLSKFLWATEV